MKQTPSWRRYLRFWRNDIVEDVDDELRFHTHMRVAEYVAKGLSEEDARRAVAERLGDVDVAKAQCVEQGEIRERHARNADFLEGVRADIRFALRSLAHAPGWTAIALLTIGLGVGATTTVFTVADALLVRPFPYRDASRVYIASRSFTVEGRTIPSRLPSGILPVWREYARTIESAVQYAGGNPSWMATSRDSVQVTLATMDSGFMAFAGIHPLIGRNFDAAEMTQGGPGAIVLDERFWRQYYGGSRDVIGSVVRIEGKPYAVVGVVPASFFIPEFRGERADVYAALPQVADGRASYLVRLRPGVTPKVATEELETLLENAHVFDLKPLPGPMPLHLTRPQDWLGIRQALVMLTAAVALLLLVACTNVAHLLLARGATRQRELAVRHALGAGRSRLIRQLVTESAVLALLGGTLAVLTGWAGLHLVSALRPPSMVALTYVSADGRVLVIAAALAILAGIGVGLLAGLKTARRDLATTLRSGTTSTSLGGRRLRGALVVGEVALSGTLLVGALLLIHSLFELQRTNLGFDARELYAVSFVPNNKQAAAARAELEARLRDPALQASVVEGVTIGGVPGPRSDKRIGRYETPDRPASETDATQVTDQYLVAPDYFATMRIPLLAGHTFDNGSPARHEVIISETLARATWPDGRAVGHVMRNAMSRTHGPNEHGPNEPWQTVIGVVPDVATSLLDGPGHPALYQPIDSTGGVGAFGILPVIVRLRGENATSRLEQLARSVHPRGETTISNVRDAIDGTLAEPRFTMRILVAFASLGVLLAAIGLFGVISYTVSQRTREIGVRMTLGASRGSIARLVVGDGVRLALLGILVGLAGAVAGTRLIQGLLYGVPGVDPFALGGGAIVLLAVTVVACAVPMWRATGVDPVISVRAE